MGVQPVLIRSRLELRDARSGTDKVPCRWRGGKARPQNGNRAHYQSAALRNGVLDGCRSNFLASIHPAIHLRTSNSLIFQALGNKTAYIPPPESSTWTSGLCTPRHVGASAAPLGRILAEKIDFQEISKIWIFSMFFQVFLSPKPFQHPTKCPPKTLG